MACINIFVKNNAAVANQLVAAKARARSHVKPWKVIGSVSYWRTEKNMGAIKMKLRNNDGQNNNEKPNGESGKFGGKSVLQSLFIEHAIELDLVSKHPKFQEEQNEALREFLLNYAESLTKHYKNEEGKGPEIYIKREDMNHFNAIAEVITAKHMGQKRVIAAIRDGQLGITTVVACDKYGLDCTIFMASYDIVKQSSSVQLINSLGAQVKSVEGNLNNALVAATEECTTVTVEEKKGNLEKSCYLTRTVVEPHQSDPDMEKCWAKPDVILGSCIGSSSSALTLFRDFSQQQDVRLIGVLVDSGMHSNSIDEQLEYPREGLKPSFMEKIGKVEFHTVADTEAIEASNLLFKLEGIFPSKEDSYAFAYLHKLCSTLPDGCKVVVVMKC